MRANQFIVESPVDELTKQLPTLKRIDYDAIDQLMQKISKRNGIEAKTLHDMFVKKHGHTPDYWIRQLRSKLDTKLDESVDSDEDVAKIKDFIEWSKKTLHIKGSPRFHFSRDTAQAQEGHHTGLHSGDDIWVYIGNRNLIDIFRTVFHELVHQRQDELGMIKDGDSYPGSPIEAMADMLAGKYIKIYGKQHTEIFQ